MRTLRSRQTGLGMLGWLIVLAAASFFLTCFFKLGPVYLDYWQAKKALDNVLSNPASATLPKTELLSSIQKHLDVSLIEVIKADAKGIRITETRDGRELDASYERRVELVGNIDAVVKFDNLKYTLPPSR